MAQDSTVKSKTTVKADDANVISLTGCLSQDKATGDYTLLGRTVAAGDDLTAKTKVKTDVDKDETKIEATTKTKSDDGAVGTSGTMSTYVVMPKGDVSLSPHVGHQVQLSAVMLKPGEDDADLKIKDKTKVSSDDAPDAKSQSKTKVEIEGIPHGQYAVVAVKPLAGTCTN
jgi:hypothetical protein